MSRTEVYVFREDGFAELYGEVVNAHRGAWMVWTLLEKKYLPSMPKPSRDMPDRYYSRFFYSCMDDRGRTKLKEVWRLANADSPLTDNERMVLISTYDWAITKREDVPKLIADYRNFNVGETSLSEQADVLVKMLDDPKYNDVIAVAFNQTSVNTALWEMGEDDPARPCEQLPYNILNEDKHFYVFEDEIRNE